VKVPASTVLGLHLKAVRPELVGDDVHDAVAGLELSSDAEEGRGLGEDAW